MSDHGLHEPGEVHPLNIIIFGATGMVGQGVLRECLANPNVEAILVIGRSSCAIDHPKLVEIIHPDLFDYSGVEEALSGYDACFFCLGISAAGLTEETYHRITFELTIAAAETLARLNSNMTFIYVSGAGTDRTGRGRVMWARVKGKTENHLLQMPFAAAYMFRPAYIQPLHGIRTKTRIYGVIYAVLGPLYPLWKTLFPRWVTTTEEVGRAMINVVTNGHPTPIVENRDINALASQSRRPADD